MILTHEKGSFTFVKYHFMISLLLVKYWYVIVSQEMYHNKIDKIHDYPIKLVIHLSIVLSNIRKKMRYFN